MSRPNLLPAPIDTPNGIPRISIIYNDTPVRHDFQSVRKTRFGSDITDFVRIRYITVIDRISHGIIFYWNLMYYFSNFIYDKNSVH